MSTIQNTVEAAGGIAYAVGAGLSMKAFFSLNRKGWIEDRVKATRAKNNGKITVAQAEAIINSYETKGMGAGLVGSMILAAVFPVSWFLFWAVGKPQKSPYELWVEDKRKDERIAELEAQMEKARKKAGL